MKSLVSFEVPMKMLSKPAVTFKIPYGTSFFLGSVS